MGNFKVKFIERNDLEEHVYINILCNNIDYSCVYDFKIKEAFVFTMRENREIGDYIESIIKEEYLKLDILCNNSLNMDELLTLSLNNNWIYNKIKKE